MSRDGPAPRHRTSATPGTNATPVGTVEMSVLTLADGSSLGNARMASLNEARFQRPVVDSVRLQSDASQADNVNRSEAPGSAAASHDNSTTTRRLDLSRALRFDIRDASRTAWERSVTVDGDARSQHGEGLQPVEMFRGGG